MQLPAPLLRRNPKLNKRDFGSVLIIAGSPGMLGAAALSSLSAMRCGAGLVTAAVSKGLNLTLQKKVSPVVMTWPLPQTTQGHLSFKAYALIKERFAKYQAIAIGPGLGLYSSTKKLVLSLAKECPLPVVIDADALNAIADNPDILKQAKGPRILTPHLGEMVRLTGLSVKQIEADRKNITLAFARRWHCVILLKGQNTVVASCEGGFYINRTGNVGMATAGSGDVLTGMIAAFLAQGIDSFDAACLGARLHGKAGDKAARLKSNASLIATDIIDAIPAVLK